MGKVNKWYSPTQCEQVYSVINVTISYKEGILNKHLERSSLKSVLLYNIEF